MKKIILPFLSALFLLSCVSSMSQSSARISKPDLELENNRVKIAFDIQGHNASDEFNVWIEITDANGNPVSAKAVSGDVGRHIGGGNGKEITWTPSSDGITLDVGIYVQVLAELEKKEEPVRVETQVQQTDEPVREPTPSYDSPVSNNVTKTNVNTFAVVGQSLILPGLGLSRETGKPHWLRGVAGYGCIASAVAFNQMASGSYDSYKTESDIQTRDELFETSVSQDNLSEIFGYAAIGIWVTDIVWNLIGTSNLNTQASSKPRGFSIEPGYNTGAQAPMLALRYKF